MRLGSWLPFAPAAAMLTHFTGVGVSTSTARRLTEGAGAAYLAVHALDLERLERELPDPPPGPACQQVSVDGAFVPLVGGTWAEVKTLSIGTVQPPVWSQRARTWQVHTSERSYFSRLADQATFSWQATVETHRRGTLSAGTVCAVADGADWCQSFIDLHRPDAVRILDFPHAVGYLARATLAVWGEGNPAAQQWTSRQAALRQAPTRYWLRYAAWERSRQSLQLWGTWRSVWTNCSIRRFRWRAIRLARAVGRAQMRWLSSPGSRVVACTGSGRRPMRWWRYAPSPVRIAGTRPGHRSMRISGSGSAPWHANGHTSVSPSRSRCRPTLPPAIPGDQPDSDPPVVPSRRPRPDHPWCRQRVGRALPFHSSAET